MRCPVCENAATTFFMRIDACDYWRCCACEATFLDPAQRLGPDQELAHYRLHRNDPTDAGYRRFLARAAEPLLARLTPGSRGLDYGCGPGPALAAMLREAGHAVALYDPFFQPDRDVLATTYDFVTCTEVAEHFHRPAEEFRRIDGLLAPGGWLALMTAFTPEDAHFAAWHYRRDPTHVVFYRENTLRRLAERHGWRCEIPCPDVALMRKLRASTNSEAFQSQTRDLMTNTKQPVVNTLFIEVSGAGLPEVDGLYVPSAAPPARSESGTVSSKGYWNDKMAWDRADGKAARSPAISYSNGYTSWRISRLDGHLAYEITCNDELPPQDRQWNVYKMGVAPAPKVVIHHVDPRQPCPSPKVVFVLGGPGAGKGTIV